MLHIIILNFKRINKMSIKVFVVNFVITAFWISFFLDSISLKFVRFMIYFFG